MARAGRGKPSPKRAVLELLEALGSSLELRVVFERAYPLLLGLVGADYGALGVSVSGDPRDFRWLVAGLPPAFFAAYPQLAPHDFVRRAVLRRPNVVLGDEQMVGRRALERNPMYRRAREVGVPLEHVMAVMLHAGARAGAPTELDARWQSGLSLYRDRRRPFTPRERQTLQDVTPAFVNAVRNCLTFAALRDQSAASPAPAELSAAWMRRLTPAQRNVTAGVLRGWDNRLIGDDLGVTTGTVKKHLQFIYDRLGVGSRAALMALALGTSRSPAGPPGRGPGEARP
jgi:DNA-binding CsgD family transcriptional regulator